MDGFCTGVVGPVVYGDNHRDSIFAEKVPGGEFPAARGVCEGASVSDAGESVALAVSARVVHILVCAVVGDYVLLDKAGQVEDPVWACVWVVVFGGRVDLPEDGGERVVLEHELYRAVDCVVELLFDTAGRERGAGYVEFGGAQGVVEFLGGSEFFGVVEEVEFFKKEVFMSELFEPVLGEGVEAFVCAEDGAGDAGVCAGVSALEGDFGDDVSEVSFASSECPDGDAEALEAVSGGGVV